SRGASGFAGCFPIGTRRAATSRPRPTGSARSTGSRRAKRSAPAPLLHLAPPALRRGLALRILEVDALALLVDAIDGVAGRHDVQFFLRVEAACAALLFRLLRTRLRGFLGVLLLEEPAPEFDLALAPGVRRLGLCR